MRFVDTGDPDVMEIHRGGGCTSLFGLIGILAGGVLIACVFIPGEVRGGDDLEWWFGLPLGGAFFAGGMAITFARWRCVMNRRRGSVEAAWNWLGHRYQAEQRRIDQLSEVSLRREVRQSSDSDHTAYAVALWGGGKRLKLGDRPLVEDALRDAERVATFLELPLVDASTGKSVRREPESLNTSLREQAERAGERPDVPMMPAQLVSDIRTGGDTLTIVIPPRGLGWGMVGTILPLVLFSGFMWWFVGRHLFEAPGEDLSLIEWWGFLAFFATFFGVGPPLACLLWLVGRATRRTTVIARPERLTVEQRSWIGRKRRQIDSQMIEELVATRQNDKASGDGLQPGVVLQTKEGRLVFGGQLQNDEREYVAGLLRVVLAS